jgi:GT2 family glycosyltransferase
MIVSIIIVNYNGLRFTRQCLESLFRYHSTDAVEVIVVDNNSKDGSQTELSEIFPSIKMIKLSENKGFGAANNAGAKRAKGDFLFFVNNDTIFLEETANKLKKILLAKKDWGIISPKLLNEDRTFQLSFGKFPSILNEFRTRKMTYEYSLQSKEDILSEKPVEKDWVTGAALMIKKDLFNSINGFDDQFFMYFEDIDLCRTVKKKGFHSLYIPTIRMVHFGGKSYVKKNNTILYEYRRSQLRYYDKYHSFAQRIMVRLYIILKFLPKVFSRTDNTVALNIIKLVFTTYN